MEPTYEQLASAVRIAHLSDVGSFETMWTRYRDDTEMHDRVVPILCVNISDLWMWGCADAESIKWEHVHLFERRLGELLANSDSHGLTIDEKSSDRIDMFTVAYAAVQRGSEPENWFTHFKGKAGGGYTPIDDASRAQWESAKQWWREALR